jgi:hypothetical protein
MVVVQGNQTVGGGTNTRVQLPRTGGYLTVPIFILRDSTNARVDGFNSVGRVRLYVDGVPRFDDTFGELQDRMYEEFQTTRPAGVIAYNFKDSLARLNLGLLDTLETAMQTNPGTLVELEMTPWGTAGTPPYILSNLQIQVVPAGIIAQGLVEAEDMSNVFAGFGIGGRQGAPAASPGTGTIPQTGAAGGSMHNPRVMYIWAAAILVLLLFHVGGASLPGA